MFNLHFQNSFHLSSFCLKKRLNKVFYVLYYPKEVLFKGILRITIDVSKVFIRINSLNLLFLNECTKI